MFRFEFGLKECIRRPIIFLNHFHVFSQYPCKKHFKYKTPLLLFSNLKNRSRIDVRSFNLVLTSNCSVLKNVAQPAESQVELKFTPQGKGGLGPVINNGQQFQLNEANLLHAILENLNEYSNTIFRPDDCFSKKYSIGDEEYTKLISLTVEDWINESADKIASSFISLGIYSSSNLRVSMDDTRFDHLISALVNKPNISSLSEELLRDCLIAIQIWPATTSVKAEQFLKVWKFLDQVCLDRCTDWSIDKMLYFMDLWFKIRLIRLSEFIYTSLKKISNKCDELTGTQMVQTLFYMSCTRKLHPGICMRKYEYNFQKHITHLSIGEIAIFASSLFKNMTTIRELKVLLYIMQRVAQEVDTIPDIAIACISKALRFSHRPEIGFTANDLVRLIMERRSVQLINAIHVLHISTQVQFYNEEPITKLAEIFCKDPSVARLKDIERVVFVLSLFNFVPPSTPDIFEIILQQLELPQHLEAAQQYPLSILSLLSYLSFFRVYPEKSIRRVLDEKFLFKSYGSKFLLPNQIVQIDYNRVLEGPPGSEHLMSPALREYVARRHSMYYPDDKSPPKMSQFDTFMREVMQLTEELLGGKENLLVTYTLPHFPRSDILIHLDDTGNPLPIPKEMREAEFFADVKRPPDPKGWYCIMVGGRNMYMHNVPRLVGEQVTKLRQLELLGYTPIMIPAHYWRLEKNKKEYLKLKLFTRKE